MVYSNHFVVCLLINNEVQQEKNNGTIVIPFNSEYTLRFRNKHSRRAVVQIYIDNENVSGGGYIIDAHGSIDIKRHSDVDRAFKFVSLDSADAIEQGKNGPNEDKVKGTIEARFFLEKEKPAVPVANYHYHHYHYSNNLFPTLEKKYGWNPNPQVTLGGTIGCGGGSCCSNAPIPRGCGFSSEDYGPVEKEVLTSGGLNLPTKDGCTVEGESTGQKFFSIKFDAEKEYTSVKIFLQGYQYSTGNQDNARELFSVYCDRCGTKARKRAKFCAKCGHYL